MSQPAPTSPIYEKVYRQLLDAGVKHDEADRVARAQAADFDRIFAEEPRR